MHAQTALVKCMGRMGLNSRAIPIKSHRITPFSVFHDSTSAQTAQEQTTTRKN